VDYALDSRLPTDPLGCGYDEVPVIVGQPVGVPDFVTASKVHPIFYCHVRAEHRRRSSEIEPVGADYCTTKSEEEAAIVSAEISRLIGTTWTDQHGNRAHLGVDDFMVVAPYNDQVHLLRDHLESNRHTRGVRVGTVDKFQGREAAVVFFTMTTSSGGDMPRGPEFLFSRNRLNVAISRARCLAYLVCTKQLLNSRARDVDEMRLIATLCSFVEYSERLTATGPQ
jgi:uncharacterized protein